MNKKTLFLSLLSVVLFLPFVVDAKTLPEMARGVQDVTWTIGTAIVVIGWTIAGILYLTSMGSPEKTGTAKKALVAAVIGTVLVVLAGLGYAGIQTLLQPIVGP